MSNKSIFFEKYNVTTSTLEGCLAEALSRGGDYADLYFEYRINHSIVLEEQIVKSATKGVNSGVGVRVVSGEKTGYAYSDDLNRESIMKAARTAAFIASSSSQGGTGNEICILCPSFPPIWKSPARLCCLNRPIKRHVHTIPVLNKFR
jgi:TldD protein